MQSTLVKWGEFGLKYALLGTIILNIFLALFGVLLAYIGLGTGFLTALVGIGLVGAVIAIVLTGVIWALFGIIYEAGINELIGWLPRWVQVSIVGTIISLVESLFTSGGTSAIVLLVVAIPVFIIVVIYTVINLYIFDKLDWEVPFE